jgi:quercetin dioxygenase-like cupin family protein
MADPIINIGVTCNVFARQIHFKNAGDVEQGHTHPYDHLSLLAKGSVQVEVDSQTTDFVAPQMIWIRADKEHKLTALTDNSVVYCIHALRGSSESDDIISPDMVPRGVQLRQMLKSLTDSPSK